MGISDEVKQGLIDGLEAVAVEYLKKQIMAELVKAAPWLFGKAIGWLSNPLIGAFLDFLLSFLVEKTVLGLSLAYIAVDIQYEVKNAEDSAKKFKDIMENPEKYTAQQIAETEESFDKDAVRLIRFNIGKLPNASAKHPDLR